MMESALLAQGLAVETCTTDDDGPGRHNGKPTRRQLVENGVIRRYFHKQSEFYKFSGGFAWWMLRHAREYDIVHIHALFSFPSVVAAWAARRAGVPYVLRPLGTLNRYGIEQRRPWLKRLSTRWIEGPLLSQAAAVHFTSVQEQDETRALGLDLQPAVISLGIEPGQLGNPSLVLTRHPALRDSKCLLFLSRLDPKKNIEGLLQALAMVKDDLPALVLLIAGDGSPEYVAHLKSFARSAGVERQVIWAGHLDGELKASAFATAQAFVLPSFSENFGIAAAEALGAGLPCILGRGVALAADAAAAGAAVSVAPTPAAIAEAIRRVLSDDGLRAAMGAAAADHARRNLSADRMGHELVALYSEILGRK
jgi:glycosyltransferase involved in cell wall biosynthesis